MSTEFQVYLFLNYLNQTDLSIILMVLLRKAKKLQKIAFGIDSEL